MKFAPEAKLLIANADGGSRLYGAALSGGRGGPSCSPVNHNFLYKTRPPASSRLPNRL